MTRGETMVDALIMAGLAGLTVWLLWWAPT